MAIFPLLSFFALKADEVTIFVDEVTMVAEEVTIFVVMAHLEHGYLLRLF